MNRVALRLHGSSADRNLTIHTDLGSEIGLLEREVQHPKCHLEVHNVDFQVFKATKVHQAAEATRKFFI